MTLFAVTFMSCKLLDRRVRIKGQACILWMVTSLLLLVTSKEHQPMTGGGTGSRKGILQSNKDDKRIDGSSGHRGRTPTASSRRVLSHVQLGIASLVLS